MRLDLALAVRGLAETRSRARDLVLRGYVLVNGKPVCKPAQSVRPDDEIVLASDAPRFVSRGAEKLIAGLDAFAFPVRGRVAIDVGASTGGFTEVLLRRGAQRVYAVDVGHGQLHPALAADPCVISLEGTDARLLSSAIIPEPVNAIVADVSFISLTKALPSAMGLAAPGTWLVALVKPQFEVGPEAVGKGGVVRDHRHRQRSLDEIVGWLQSQHGWRAVDHIVSPITGGSGNVEFVIGAVRVASGSD